MILALELGDDIAAAIEDHYKPRFAGDDLPRNETGVAVALADKLETLSGLFAIGQVPTGDKDPFALRRHALGVIRILVEKNLPLQLGALVDWAVKVQSDESLQEAWSKRQFLEARQAGGAKGTMGAGHAKRQLEPGTRDVLLDFFFERLTGWLRDQSYSSQEVDAVLSLRPERIAEVPKLLAAVRAFKALPEAEALAAANKRVGNILKKSDAVVTTMSGNALPGSAAFNEYSFLVVAAANDLCTAHRAEMHTPLPPDQ